MYLNSNEIRWPYHHYVILFLFSLILQSCNSSQTNPMIGDLGSLVICPPSGCAGTAPLPEGVFIQRDQNKEIFLDQTDTTIEIAGLCSYSTFFDNRIEVKSGGNPITFYSVNMSSSALIPKCSMGKFFLYVDACQFKQAAIYSLQVQLIPLDNTLQPVVAEASFSVNFRRSAPALATITRQGVNYNVCP